MVGKTISHYKITDKLGEGGMGVVYKAEDTILHRTVALKFLSAKEVEREELKTRFLREAQAAASLDHPNICTVYEVGESDRQVFLAMACIDGLTLRQRIDKRPLKLEEALDLAIQVGEGLTAAHEKKIVHRDIKSSNIMLTSQGRVKITDFGLAHLGGRTKLTRTGASVGTPAYMSPEQARGEPVDRRSDIWSLGVVLYEMVAGRLPFEADSEQAVLRKILDEEPEPLTAVRSRVPVKLDGILAKLLTKDPAERYQHVEDVVVDLRTLRRKLETGTRAAADGSEGKKRKRLAVTAAALLTLLVTIGIYRIRSISRPIDSLAVLPFANVVGDANLEYLTDGIPAALTNILARQPGLRLTPSSRAFVHKGPQVDPVKAGKDLGVRAILTGRVALRGESLTIQVELVDVEQDAQLWGEQFSRRVTEISAVQDQIARTAAAKLRFQPAGHGAPGAATDHTGNSEAYQRFLRGRYYWDKRTIPMLRQSVVEFRQALDIDPSYARAYAGLAEAYAIFAIYNVSIPADAAPLAKAAIDEALRRDETIAEAHTALAFVRMTYDFDLEGADRSFRRALELNPQHPTAHFWYGLYHTARRQHARAVEHLRLAQQSAPLSANVNSYLAWVLWSARRTDEAIEQIRRTLEIDPNFPNAHLFLGWCYQQQGRHAEAVEEMVKARELSGDNLLMIGALGHGMAAAGRRDVAFKVLAEMTALSRERYVAALDFAHVHCGLKDKDKTFEWLEKAHKERSAWIMWIDADPRYDWLRSDPRFTSLLTRLRQAS